MGLFKREKRTSAPQRSKDQSSRAYAGDPAQPGLPGSAGYRGTDPLPKNCMPQSRFTYVRPDGRRD